MLHDGHQLYGIVTQSMYPRKHICREFFIGANTVFGRRNSNMGLIYSYRSWLRRTRVFKLVSFRQRWVPETCFISRREGQILGNASNPGRDTLDTSTRGCDHGNLNEVRPRTLLYITPKITSTHLDLGVMRYGAYPRSLRRDCNFPNTKFILFQRMGQSMPLV
jgi:hypothetical protein